MVLLTLLAIAALAMVRQTVLFSVVILASIYSFLIASVMVIYDAVDVAMTEAAVGAGVSTVLLLAALHLTGSTEAPQYRRQFLALFVAGVTGAAVVWGTLVLPPFGMAEAPIHTHVVPRYLEKAVEEASTPNVVTAVLADYRGYDTLGEVTVVFTAGMGVMLLLRRRSRRTGRKQAEADT